MSQTRFQSFMETCASTVIGFVIAYIASYLVLPWFGFRVSHEQNFYITCIFTIISLVRGWCVRRLFNRIHGVKP